MGCSAKAQKVAKWFFIVIVVAVLVFAITDSALKSKRRSASANGRPPIEIDDEWFQHFRDRASHGHRRGRFPDKVPATPTPQTNEAQNTYQQVMAADKASNSMSELHAVFLDGIERGADLNLVKWSEDMTLEELCQFIAGKPGVKYTKTAMLVHPDRFDRDGFPENERKFRCELFKALSVKNEQHLEQQR
ncbi:J domain-containing protein [Plasmodiophora brassicae]|uniref:Uncharacterized protein n=1 Tax=Plasmodiophora brassicae TaxID=37360 RepID=A0A3P3YN85_PLABS|nr:unnamed protein product [Plasmodiophora brassicae]